MKTACFVGRYPTLGLKVLLGYTLEPSATLALPAPHSAFRAAHVPTSLCLKLEGGRRDGCRPGSAEQGLAGGCGAIQKGLQLYLKWNRV